MDKQKKLRVFYSDISALRDRSDQPQLWEFLSLRQTTENKTM